MAVECDSHWMGNRGKWWDEESHGREGLKGATEVPHLHTQYEYRRELSLPTHVPHKVRSRLVQ